MWRCIGRPLYSWYNTSDYEMGVMQYGKKTASQDTQKANKISNRSIWYDHYFSKLISYWTVRFYGNIYSKYTSRISR